MKCHENGEKKIRRVKRRKRKTFALVQNVSTARTTTPTKKAKADEETVQEEAK